MRVRIPSYAKSSARKALNDRNKFPPSRRPGLTKAQAQKQGINSGVERAKQIIRNEYLPEKDAKRVAAFYSRFKNKTTPRAEVAIGLWGGRRFGKALSSRY